MTLNRSTEENMGTKRFFKLNYLNGLKALIGIICLIVFLYQMIALLIVYKSHPTVLDVQLKKPEEFIFPAFTFCNANLIKRSKYCEAYPEKCAKPENMTIFCERYPHYCDTHEDPVKVDTEREYEDDFLIPKEKYYIYRDKVPMNELVNFSHNASTILFATVSKDDIEGPKFYQKPKKGTLIPCFTQFSRVESELEPKTSAFAPFEMFARQVSDYPQMISTLTLDIEPKEYFNPTEPPGAYFALHSPFESISPHYKGTFMKPGKSYHVHLRLEEDHLSAFGKDCVDYEEKWRKQSKKGARSEQMCEERCSLEYSLACSDCVARPIIYPTKSPKCSFRHLNLNCGDKVVEQYMSCKSSCKKECSKLKYMYTVQEADDAYVFPEEKWKYIEIHVYMDEPHILDRTYIPKIHYLEAFSGIGGFLCIWLCIFLFLAKLVDLINEFVFSNKKQHSSVNSIH